MYFFLVSVLRLITPDTQRMYDFVLRKVWVINAGEGVEKREPSYTVGGNAN